MHVVEKHSFVSLCALLWSSTTTSAWVVVPSPAAPARAPLQGQTRHATALGARVGDYFNSGSDEDDASAAARESRESLERMWANSASESNQELDQGDDQLLREVREALPELKGEGVDGDSAMVSPGVLLRYRVVIIFTAVVESQSICAEARKRLYCGSLRVVSTAQPRQGHAVGLELGFVHFSPPCICRGF